MRRYWIDLKNIRLHFWVPVIAALILVPLTVWGFYQISGNTEDITEASSLIQMYLPFLSIWWIVFVFRQYADGNGRELLHMHCKSQLIECLFFQALFLLITAVPYVLLSFFYEDMAYEYLRIAVQSFALSSLTYCILFVSRSATASILVSLIYVVVSWFVKVDFSKIIENTDSWLVHYNPIEYFNIFSVAKPALGLPWFKLIVPLIAGMVFLLIGRLFNRRMFR